VCVLFSAALCPAGVGEFSRCMCAIRQAAGARVDLSPTPKEMTVQVNHTCPSRSSPPVDFRVTAVVVNEKLTDRLPNALE
jgi:hypothetical protein